MTGYLAKVIYWINLGTVSKSKCIYTDPGDSFPEPLTFQKLKLYSRVTHHLYYLTVQSILLNNSFSLLFLFLLYTGKKKEEGRQATYFGCRLQQKTKKRIITEKKWSIYSFTFDPWVLFPTFNLQRRIKKSQSLCTISRYLDSLVFSKQLLNQRIKPFTELEDLSIKDVNLTSIS